MIPQAIPLFDMPLNCSQAVQDIVACLQAHQWQVVRSFDLQIARAAHQRCACPHHGTAACGCQMVVLLLYGQTTAPLTLLIHGRENVTHVSLVSSDESDAWVHALNNLLRTHFWPAGVS